MSVTSGMFLFEVVVGAVNSLVSSRHLIIKSDFGDIFSLELKDPKTMHIVMPEPPPLPPEPPGKKKKKPKPKPKKKGKKGAVEAPPPEPAIQSGQSVLFGSSAEFLLQTMAKYPLEVSLWSKEDNLVFIGSVSIPWDPIFEIYLKKVIDNQKAPPVTLKDDYNIFEEGKAKIMAKIGMQVKLTYLTSKLTTSFRTLSEDPAMRKYLYTGINCKTTSYMCTLKTTDEEFAQNCNKIPNNFIVDKPSLKANKINYADYKNAPGANLAFINEGDYCCMKHADKPPESIYKSPETCPDVDHIIDYVRKIIVSCNDNMRMLTPRPTIRPRIKATDMDRLCYCKQKTWPESELADRFKKEALSEPCPLCIDAGKKPEGSRPATFDIANIRGPCGKPDCKIARDMRSYIEHLVEEDNEEFNVNELIGPCGSKDCTLAQKINDFLHRKGVFSHDHHVEGLSTQCDCLNIMQNELTKRESCDSLCSKDCKGTGSDASSCRGEGCPYSEKNKVYNIYYFTVEHDFDKKSESGAASSTTAGSTSPANTTSPKPTESAQSNYTSPKSKESKNSDTTSQLTPSEKSKFPHCSHTCPSVKMSEKASCSKTTCSVGPEKFLQICDDMKNQAPCGSPVCPKVNTIPPSPADSDIVIKFDEITNPCCVKSCDIAEHIKDYIAESALKGKRKRECAKELTDHEDPCYCDCVCTFKFSSKTTYCPVCGGYQCLGDDVKNMPDFQKPHPCPIYHKLYDKNLIKTTNPWPEEKAPEPEKKAISAKASKIGSKSVERAANLFNKLGADKEAKRKEAAREKVRKTPIEVKTIGKFTANAPAEPTQPPIEKKPETKYPYPAVPKHMGWNWTAEDIPGLKPRPKWRPGAANKILVRRYRALREGIDTIAKKKRAMLQRKKKVEVKPALIVTKRDGEFTVEMEVFKKYSKERLLYQYPYEERPPLTYVIGKTDEEKKKVQKQREKKARRETRRKSQYLQSSFRDKCQEICLKAYDQAIGMRPLPNPNDPDCPCTTMPKAESSPMDSCSCSEVASISSSDTDNDEWVVEFSPPAGKWDPRAKHAPCVIDSETQYTYLDYKVKILDRLGNPVPRFFKSHEGKTECSDLGGFWGPGKVWLEINKDGYIGPDERWVPMSFTGPDGMLYSAEEGLITDSTGQVLRLGIDGYVDKDLKFVYYSKKKQSPKSVATASSVKASTPGSNLQGKGDGKTKPSSTPIENLPASKSKSGEKTNPPVAKKSAKHVKAGKNNPLVMSLMVDYPRRRRSRLNAHKAIRQSESERKKLAKYNEIMGEFEMYEDIKELIPTVKTNRASNTPIKMYSPASRLGAKLRLGKIRNNRNIAE